MLLPPRSQEQAPRNTIPPKVLSSNHACGIKGSPSDMFVSEHDYVCEIVKNSLAHVNVFGSNRPESGNRARFGPEVPSCADLLIARIVSDLAVVIGV